ncbi:SUMF1/EgtB/PvdO family nonheme iron enzyme [Candidatus Accumulibacter sp. ACC003]|uniref:SUMF1/EgtB/PvdO family nonheme iron enzyme n=1 Tax=Candidatus Accumulibacter sp. ACC003 TaxID=2823334 RepID=UPI0025B90FE2|nr:SUMF1/EgtB/PvdO family nonheme iron enzyme [Candidatus Accumulibacter sp. ACC003]
MTSSPRPLSVFLCHSSQDKAFVRDLYGKLQRDGVAPWLDEEDLLPGQHWDREIRRAVRASDLVLVCLSKGSVSKAGYLQKEIKFVLDVAAEQPDGSIFLVPARIEEGVQISYVAEELGRKHWVDLFHEAGYQRLQNALQARARECGASFGSTTPATPASPASAGSSLAIERPAWASGAGKDAYGQFAEIEVANIVQRFRWIMPGRFLMGSPAGEAERSENELQHEVMLSRGFWLADTACTQALWQVVTGNNPSRLKDDPKLPVENVSWNDVQAFLAELNRHVPGLQARLPSEAEWEYACRAGTTTAFSFGENITPEQVNYDGNYPYADGRMGLYRGCSVPITSMPANAWGLHEMHGNVLEWCADPYGDYPTAAQVDPSGPQAGDNRVLRGGSSSDDGSFVRCAYRSWEGPDLCDRIFGFRFALGHPGPAEPA